MPTKTMRVQNGNSCAAHCTVIAVEELIGASGMDADSTEGKLWPDIKFRPEAGVPMTQALALAENSDPRRIVAEVGKRWPRVKATMLCDGVQKRAAIPFVNTTMQGNMEALFNLLAGGAVNAPVLLDDAAFYSCSYTMHGAATPSAGNFSGMHNILVTLEGGKSYYYNSNESKPRWTMTKDWKRLESQNDGHHSYIFSGVCVVMT